MGILERARSVLRVDAIELVRGTEDLVGSLQALAEDLDDDLAELEEAAARAAREAERLLHEAREADARAADALDQARDALRDGDEARARRLVGTHVDAHARARRIGERAAARRRDARDLEALVQPLAHRLDEVRNLAKRPPDDGGESSTQPRAAPEPDDGPARVEAILTKLAEELREEPDTAPGVPHAAQRHPDD